MGYKALPWQQDTAWGKSCGAFQLKWQERRCNEGIPPRNKHPIQRGIRQGHPRQARAIALPQPVQAFSGGAILCKQERPQHHPQSRKRLCDPEARARSSAQ